MDNIWTSIGLSLITGIVSSFLVVIYFEFRQYKKYSLSRAHILERFSRELFHILTTIRVTSDLKLSNSSFGGRNKVVAELEHLLGRENPEILMERMLNLTPEKHRYLFSQLLQIHDSLYLLFSHSIGHKTIEDSVSASIAEMQEWISTVLSYYNTYPEIIERKVDQSLYMVWMTSIANLAENSFTTLRNVLDKQDISEDMLRWGSRTK